MSVPVPIDKLSLAELKTISKDLTLYPRKKGPHKDKVLPVTCFNKTTILNDKNELIECVMLPYRYGINKFNDRVIPPVNTPAVNFEFTKTEATSLRDEQIPVVNEALKHLDDYSTTTLNIRTGFGKTICSFYIAAEINEKTLIIVTGDTIKTGWYKAGCEHTNAKIDIVKGFTVAGNRKDKFTVDECKQWLKNKELNPKNNRKIKINAAVYNNLLYDSKEYGLIKGELYGYDIDADILICMKDRYKYVPRDWPNVLIIDEADTFCNKTGIESILWFRPTYVMILTATYEREDMLHKILEYVGDNHKIVRELKRDYKVFKFETGLKPTREYNSDFTLDWDTYMKSVINDPERIEQIIEFLSQNVKDHKILVLSSCIKIIEDLESELTSRSIKCDTLTGTKKAYNDSNVLLGTLGKLGRGFDEKNFCEDYSGIRINLLLLTTTFQSSTLYTQTVGRVMRACNPIVVHMVDDDTTAENHWKKACKFYNKSGATVVSMV